MTALAQVPRLRIRDLDFDLLNLDVRRGAKRVALSRMEHALLCILALNKGTTVSREDLRETLWGRDSRPTSNALDRHMSAIRRKLGDDWRKPRYIEDVRGKGYRTA